MTYIGYKTVKVTAAPQLDIVMKEDNQMMEELVVTGYTTQRKADLTGAVSVVNMDDIADLQYERLSQAHDFYTTRGWCPTSKKDQLCRMYKSYTGKGRNHLSAHYEQDILDLPETPAEMEER